MTGTNRQQPHNLTPALEAIGSLFDEGFANLNHTGKTAALSAHYEIERTPASQKTGLFYRHLRSLRDGMVALLADTYRRCFKLALAHPRETGSYAEQWAFSLIQPAIIATLEWLRDWYILACDGENQYVRNTESVRFVPGQTVSVPIPLTAPPFPPPESWRAPAWLFQISDIYVGIGLIKSKHEPPNDSEGKLGAAHTRLLLKGAKKVFLRELGAAIERVRNEETAAAGAIPAQTVNEQTRGPNKRKGWEQKQKLYSAIQKVLSANPNLQGTEFCAELDKRHAPPLYDWTKCGDWPEGLTWKEAWNNRALRKKIRRVRQEAKKR